MCSDNSATSQQLAAGMQETAATTVNINENVGTMKEEADRLTEMAEKVQMFPMRLWTEQRICVIRQ